MLRRLSGERGIALVMALGVLVALSISAIALIGYSSSTVRTSRYGTSREAAYALGEAGVNEALSILANTSNPTNSALLSPTTVQLAGGSTTYSGVLSGQIWTLTGVGSIPNPTGPSSAPVTRTVTRLVSLSSVSVGSFSGLWDRIYSDATGACSVTVNAGMNIPSNFAAKGDVCLNDSSITGSGTTVDVGGKVTITGSAGTTSGPNSPSAGTGWTNPTNVYTSNSVYATNVIAAGATGATQDTTGFGFAIPAGATIGGITASVKRHASTGAVSITHDASSSTTGSSVSSTSWSHTVANQTDRMLVVGVTAENSTSGCQASGVTYSGQALTKITQSVTTTSPYVCASEWYLTAPPVGTANVVVTFGGTIQYVTAGATSLYNVKQGAPDASNSSFSNTALTSTSVTTLNPNSWVVDSFGSGQPGALTAGAGQTSRWTQTVGSQEAGGMSTEAVASPGSVTMSWTQAGTTGTSADVLADNPVSYWRLGETSGTTAVDQKGANNGTYTGGYTLNQTGALTGDSDKAVLLNGTSGYVNVGNPTSLKLNTGTLEAWIKTANAGTSWRDIICKTNAWCITLKANILDFYSYNPDGDRLTTINVADNTWHHVAATFQSGVTNGTKVYFDGSLVLTATAGVKDQLSVVEIGNSVGTSEFFAGTIDEAAIYNTVLSATQIQRHYAGDNRTAQVVAAFSPVASGIVDSNVVLLKGGAPAGSNYADTASIWGTSDATITYGSDLWGTTWTPAEVNASNFGVRLIAKNLGGPSTTGSIDYISITVTYWAGTPPGIGTPGTPVARANISGTCKWAAQTAHTPCSATDHVWASSITTTPANLTRPTINWQYWYDNAAPGPKHGCTTSTGTPPVFDSNTTYDGLNSDQELTPEGAGASYTCQAKDANGTVIGELSWNNSTRVLDIKGTIFFDGTAQFHTHDFPAWHYHGRGVIYISRKWHNDEPVCAGSATTDCRATGMPAWDTNTDLLVLVIGGKNTPGSDDFDFHRNNSAFQGAIYSVNTCRLRETAYMQGPLNCGALDFDVSSPSFFAWPPLPNSTPGQIYTTGTDSDVQLVIGAQSG